MTTDTAAGETAGLSLSITTADGAEASARTEIVFVDARVHDYDTIVQGISPTAEVVLIDSSQDGVQQMAEALSGRSGVDAIHIVSHGDDGVLLLGNGPLHAGNMEGYAVALAQVGQALTAGGDIQLWGCEVGAGEKGQAFVDALAQATGADVAASSDGTGQGGDWELEIRSGEVTEPVALDAAALASYEHSLATFTASNLAELQSALTMAASNGQADTITLLADISASGTGNLTNGYLTYINLAETHALTIVGGGHALDANYYGGVVSVSSGDNVEFQNLTIRGGLLAGAGGDGGTSATSSLGAGVVNHGNLTLDSVTVTANVASGGGGGGGVSPDLAGGGGGGGGGFNGTGGGTGGNAMHGTGFYAGVAGASGTGGRGGGYDATYMGGRGGSTTGGNGGIGTFGYSNGGAGATATNGLISIGGGGGGAGWNTIGGTGGSAAGGIFNASGATLTIVGTSIISNNLGAGGGGGGGSGTGSNNLNGGDGGRGVGAIWNEGTLQITASNFSAMTSNAGASGQGGLEGGTGQPGVTPTSHNNIYTSGTGITDSNYVPNPAPALDANGAGSGTTHVTTFTEDGGAIRIATSDAALTDDDTLTGMTLVLSAAPNGVLESITYDAALNGGATLASLALTGSYNSATHTYTLSGTASAAVYQGVLRAMVYNNTSQAPDTATRTITVSATDAEGATGQTTSTITVTAVNDAPTAMHLSQTKAVTEGGAAIALDDIVVSDVDGSDAITATLTLSNPAAGSLSTGTFGAATSTFNAGTGVWTITGSVTDVNAALAAVTLTPSANNDQNFTVTTRIQDTSNTGPADGTITVTVTPVNDAPTATHLSQSKGFTEDAVPVALNDIVVSDVEPGDTITATLTLSNPAAGSLSDGTFGSATSTYVASTGVWTITGSVTDVNAALAAVSFTPTANWDQNVTITTRIRDAANMGPADGTITLTAIPVNDAPTLGTNLTASTDTGNSLTITSAQLNANDPDDAGTGLTYTITDATDNGTLFRDGNGNNVVDGGEALGASSTFTQDDINQGLIKYRHGGGAGTGDSFTFSLADGGEDGAVPVTGQTFNIAVAARPVVSVGSGSAAHAEDGGATVIAPGLTVSDTDSAMLSGATITITDYVAGDILSFTNASGIVGSFNAATGVLTLSGSATVTDYQAALRSVTYSTTSNNPATGAGNADRVIEFRVNDGQVQSVAGTSRAVTVTNTNDAPVLDVTQSPALTGISEDVGSPTNGSTANSTLVSALLGGMIDVDTGALQGVAVVGVSGQGSLWYSTDGGASWSQVTAALSATNALVLHSDARLSFRPAANFHGTVADAITIKAWDRTDGQTNGTTGIDTTSGSSFSTAADTVSLTVGSVNDSPVLADTPLALDPVVEDPGSPVGAVGTLVSSLTGGISDADPGDPAGIAIVGADTGNGIWFFSTDNGAHWQSFGALSIGAARLLLADAGTRVYFQPAANYQGTVSAALTIRAWDGTTGTNGGTADTTSTGGATAFSATTNLVSVTVTPVNDAPTLSGGPVPLTGTNEDSTSSSTLVSTILASVMRTDADPGSLAGLAITGATGNGTWQYSTDGVAWTDFGSLSEGSALLLGSTMRIRFVGDGANGGPANFTFRAWDQTSGMASANGMPQKADVSVNGGATAFSAGTATAQMTVTSVNDAPILANIPSTPMAVIDGRTIELPDITVTDVDSDTLSVTLTATNGTINNLVDADPDAAGLQLTGTASTINAQLADATFTAASVGTGSVAISVTDGISTLVTGALELVVNPAGRTVDGVLLQTETITNPDGSTSQVITIPVVRGSRSETDGDV
uniref:DUF4347 domain-containing protein n=1 Tax=Microvirga roseola TaxID=2883126 RepID=UPI0022A89669